MEKLYHNYQLLSSFLYFALRSAKNKPCGIEIMAKCLTKSGKKCTVNSEN